MKVNLFTLDNSAHDNLMSFFMSVKKIKFVFKNILLLNSFKNENNLILVPHEIKNINLKTSIKNFKLSNLLNSCYLIPNKFNKETTFKDVQSIN